MPTTVADRLVDCLLDWGVEIVFGLPGDGINGLIEALRTRQDRIRFLHVRHEESAALMACAYAKVTGKLGVCMATSGPGGLHLLNGLYDAKLDGQPVLAITGLPYHDLLCTFTQQDVELDKVFENVAVYNTRVMGPTHVENVTHLACRSALGRRGVAHIAVPTDIQMMPVEGQRSPRNIPGHTADTYAGGIRVPEESLLDRAAEVLNAGKRVAILAGRGALDARAELLQVAERLAAPIAKPLLGKAVVPDDSPYTTGAVGFLGTDASMSLMETCDTLLMVGTSFPYLEYLPKPGQARAVQIDSDPMRIALRYPVEIPLVGHSHATLQALLPRLRRNPDRSFLEKAQSEKQAWQQLLEERAVSREKPMKPQVVAAELGKRLRGDAIIAADSGTSTVWWARHISAQPDQQYIVSGTLATMACALPYALAAQAVYPEKQCVAFMGDGGFSMLMGEFITAAQYGLPIKVIVLNNRSLAYIRWEQMLYGGHPEFGIDLKPIDFAAVATACGGTGFRIEDPSECGHILEEALSTPGPVIVDAVVDPLEPPTPPKISPEQAQKFLKALKEGEPNQDRIQMTSLAEKVREMV
jgi:pyruvate dehydrogenase (quinone)